MSFSSEVKDEAVKIKLKNRGERIAVLSGITHCAGTLSLTRAGMGVNYVTESLGLAKLVSQLADTLYGIPSEMLVTEHERLSARNIQVRLSGAACRDLLIDTGCLAKSDSDEISRIPDKCKTDDELRRCFIRGAFLGSGSVTDPQKAYHAEIVCRSEMLSSALTEMLNFYELNSKYVLRKSNYIVYMKDGDKVSDFLALLQTMEMTLRFEDVRMKKTVINNINRKTNFEFSNMQKAALNAASQKMDIDLILLERGLESLPDKLRAVAEARLSMPEATLSELSEELDISKSGLNHRFKRIAAIADEIRLEKGDIVYGGE